MKTTKKLLMGLGFALLGSFAAKSQGLQGIIVEKFYQTNVADGNNAAINGGTLVTGSTVYRVYVDMAPGYKYVQAFGSATHPWKISTSTFFFNDGELNNIIGASGTNTNSLQQNTRRLDSYLTIGGIANNQTGVLKTEDVNGAINSAQGILQNNPGGVYGFSITGAGGRDGMATTTGTTFGQSLPNDLGLAGIKDVFDFNAAPGGTFLSTGGSVVYLGGCVGSTTTNAVYIGQFTTDGVFGFEFNVQLLDPLGVAETWVANNPQGGEFTHPQLTLAPNTPPTVNVTGPTNIITGNVATFSATAADVDGTVTAVQFQVDGVNFGSPIVGTTGAPTVFTINWNSTVGTHTITAIATDDDLDNTTSNNHIITAANNQAPIVTVSAPAGAVAGLPATFSATANDLDGTVASVSFSVDNVLIGTTSVGGPSYTMTWTAVFGAHNVKASATDNLGLVGTSAQVAFNVVNNIPPSVSITQPLNNSIFTGTVNPIVVSASASDADGVVTSVEFFANNISIGVASGPTYSVAFIPTSFGAIALKAVATDNAAGTNTSAIVTINIANPNALPYAIGAVKQQCNEGTFCLPISAASTYTVDNVIGYDLVLNYDAARVTPTGSITINGALITPSFVTVIHSFSNGTMNISAYLNSNAPGNAEWNGTGDIFCVGFVKNTMTEVDTAVYSISSLDESYFIGVTPKLVSNGRYTTYRDTTFDARVVFQNSNFPLSYNPANPNDYLITDIYGSNNACVTNMIAPPVQPDMNGHFTYNNLNGSSISIKRDIASGTDVQPAINIGDWAIGQAVLLNSATLTPSVYQIIALDVNLDGVVSSGDLTQLNQRTVLSIPEFKQAWNYNAAGTNTLGQPSKDWIFVDSLTILNNPAYAISTTYPQNNNVGYSRYKVPSTPFCLSVPQTSLGTCPTIDNATYRGIMVGDADGNFSTLSGTLQLRPNGDKVVLDLSKSIVNGNTVEVPVSFKSSTPVIGVDLALKFDESSLSYSELVNFSSTSNALAHLNANDKILRMTCGDINLNAYGEGQSVAFIRFETKDGVIEADQLKPHAGYLNGQQVAVEVLGKTVGIASLNGDNSVSIYPNPTSGILNITSISDATVQMFDVTGKEVVLQTTLNSNKTQQINVSSLTNGVYFVKIQNNDFVTIKKVVLSK